MGTASARRLHTRIAPCAHKPEATSTNRRADCSVACGKRQASADEKHDVTSKDSQQTKHEDLRCSLKREPLPPDELDRGGTSYAANPPSPQHPVRHEAVKAVPSDRVGGD